MKILLLKEVKGLGRAGDIKEASDGHAFNFLIPRGLARAVTANTTNVVLAQKAKQERLKNEFKKEREKLARKINSQTFSIIAKVDKNGTLYGGLDSKALAKELAKQKLNLSPDEIILPATIKKIGQYKVELKLGEEKVNINIEVKSE